jgi:hypothetical protein
MKITTEGLTLGLAKRLNESGYSVVVDEDGHFAEVQKERNEPKLIVDKYGWGALSEYME